MRCYAVVCVALAVVVAFVQIVLDPYDTGRFAPFGDFGVAAFGQRLTAASLARRPQVEAATLGNSTIQSLHPRRLRALTGHNFVSLALAATGPLEQMAVAHWLVKHHDGKSSPALRTLVIDIDSRWCRGDGMIELTNPFPFWLYGDRWLPYMGNLVSVGTFGAVGKKLRLMLGDLKPLRADGYRDYDMDFPWNTAEDLRAGMTRYAPNGKNFAGLRHLQEFLPELPATTLVILLFPPRYYTSIPKDGTAEADDTAACKAAYRAVAATRPRTVVLDLLKDDPMLHVDAYFLDRVHFLVPVAEKVEGAIADVVHAASPSAASTEFGGK